MWYEPQENPLYLRATGSAPEQYHLFPEEQIWAINAALVSRRPLLLRGEPGTGKSQLARAAAEMLQRPLITYVVTSQTTSEDLLYEFDAVARLGQAQLLSATGGRSQDGVDSLEKSLAPIRFLRPGPLWWAFQPKSAETQRLQYYDPTISPPCDPEKLEAAGKSVLLIDEIDKAEPDVPNGLLDALGNGGFQPPHGAKPVLQTQEALIIITTNEERELPAAFLRRCLVLNIELPKDDEELITLLIQRGHCHFQSRQDEIAKDLFRLSAQKLVEERNSANQRGLPKPGQAEYLDFLRAAFGLLDKGQTLDKVMENVAPLVLKKSGTS